MTVFKTFLKVLNKNRFIVILYTVILLCFSAFNMQSQDEISGFSAERPSVVIVNNDTDEGITGAFTDYLEEKCDISDIENDEDKISDALFYREVSYVVCIPEGFGADILSGEEPRIDVRSSGNYSASLAEMIVSKYLRLANIYAQSMSDEAKIIESIDRALSNETEVEITSTIDTDALSSAAFYFNFESYSLLACLIYVICTVLSVFNDQKIKKRTIISSMDYRKHNRILLLSNWLYAAAVWLLYMIFSFIFVGKIMFSIHGVFYALNSFVFTMCAASMAVCIGTAVRSKNAVNGIANVVALGSSFLCGAFVPQEWLPDSVIKIAHVLPTYYYISSNNTIRTLETFSLKSLEPVLVNMVALAVFCLGFIVLTNIISGRKRVMG